MNKLVLLRHGESEWNKENRFTGWTDVDLSCKGIDEARKAGIILKKKGFTFDIAFTSVLIRATRTLEIVLDRMDLAKIPARCSWRLNEKHYGALQGSNKKDTVLKYGEKQVLLWRRSYDVAPPPLDKSDARYPGNDPKYKDLDESELPLTECLKDTVERYMPYWHDVISREVASGRKILIVAHGNSLRALVKHLDNVSDEDIVDLDIPTGVPLVYEFDDNTHSVKHYYLGDPDAVKKAMDDVASQGKTDKQ